MTKYITKLISGDQMYYLKDTEAREALVDKTEKGVANGIATLDSSGKVPSSQLPSYVDDVLEGYSHNGQFYATLTPGEEGEPDTYSDLITPETGKIYVDKATNNTFRWSGSAYIMIGSSGGGGYTAGNGIDITNAEISVDNTVLRNTDVDSTIPSTSSSNVPTSDAVKSYVDAGLDDKVDKISGKGLSTNDYTDDDKTTLDGLSVLSPVVSGNRVTSNTPQWTMFASVDYPSVSRYDDIVLLVQGLGYYYTGQDTGCWIVECRTRYKNSTGPNDIGMTITELLPTGIPLTGTNTGTVQFGYYTDTTEGKTYFGVYTSTRHHYIETIKIGGQNIEHLKTRKVLTEAPAGWSTLALQGVETRKCLSEQDFSMSYQQQAGGGTLYHLTIGGSTYDIADTNTDTHYTTKIYAGGSKATAHATATSPYITVTDDGTYRNQVRLIGSGGTTVSSDASGNITISSTDNDTDNYRYITYTTNVVENSSASLSLDGRIPVHFVTTTANITGLTLSSNPPDGHECHVLITASASKTVTIAYNSSSRVTPDKNSITLTIPAGGYVEVNFIRVNGKTYVRAI